MYISIVVSLTVDNGWKYGRSLKYYDTFTIQYTEYQCMSTCSLRDCNSMQCDANTYSITFHLVCEDACLAIGHLLYHFHSVDERMDAVYSVFFCSANPSAYLSMVFISLLAFFLSLFIYISLAIDVHTDMIAVGIAAPKFKK